MTFYKGHGQDIVILNYTNGFFREQSGMKTMIASGTNKYNIKFIGDINELNMIFYSLILAEKVAIKLMKMNDDNYHGEIANLWNLIKAQSGTIRFNKKLKHALKEYKIDRKDVLKKINADITSQYERTARNETLLRELLTDYGLDFIVKMIEEESGMSFVKHITEFIQSGELVPDVDKTEHYEIMTNRYIERLIQMAESVGKSLNNDVSDALKNHRIKMKEKSEERKAKSDAYKAENKKKKALAAINADASKVQHDINASYDVKSAKGIRNVSSIFRKIANTGGSVWYVATAKISDVYYVTKDMTTTKDIGKAVFFKTLEEAKDFAKRIEVSQDPDLKNATVSCQRLITVAKNKSTDNKLQFLSASLKDELATNMDARIIKKAILKCNGYNSDCSDVEFVIYTAICTDSIMDDFGNTYFATVKDNDEMDLYFGYSNIIPLTVDEVKERDIFNRLKMKYKGYKIEEHIVKIKCKWHEKRIRDIRKENRLINQIVNTESLDKLIIDVYEKNGQILTAKYSKDSMNKLRNQIHSYGLGEFYYILEKSHSKLSFYCEKSRSGLTQNLSNITFFPSMEEAMEAYIKNYDKNRISVSKIMKLKIA